MDKQPARITQKEWRSQDLSPCLIPKPVLSQCVQWMERARPRVAGGGADPRHRYSPRSPVRRVPCQLP